jgi:hypothetical protein
LKINDADILKCKWNSFQYEMMFVNGAENKLLNKIFYSYMTTDFGTTWHRDYSGCVYMSDKIEDNKF